MSIEELKSRIISLNEAKNIFAEKKLKNELKEGEEKELISNLIYVISELRQYAHEIGISHEGKVDDENELITEFKYINEGVNNLKSQILMLVNSSIEELHNKLNNMRISGPLSETGQSGPVGEVGNQEFIEKKEKKAKDANNKKTAENRLKTVKERLKNKLTPIKE